MSELISDDALIEVGVDIQWKASELVDLFELGRPNRVYDDLVILLFLKYGGKVFKSDLAEITKKISLCIQTMINFKHLCGLKKMGD